MTQIEINRNWNTNKMLVSKKEDYTSLRWWQKFQKTKITDIRTQTTTGNLQAKTKITQLYHAEQVKNKQKEIRKIYKIPSRRKQR